MKVIVHPSRLEGTLLVPASKSVMQRACAAALIRKGETRLYHPGHSADDKAAIEVIEAMGATVQKQDDHYLIKSNGLVAKKPLLVHCGESGLGMRMFTPIAACLSEPVTLDGHGSLHDRPMGFFDQVLPPLGVKVRTTGGRLPIQVQGPLVPSNIQIDGKLSSQFLTGLLFAYSAAAAKQVVIEVEGLVSKPYIDLTLSIIRAFGLPCPENKAYQQFYFSGQTSSDQQALTRRDPFSFWVESDWSSASFFLVAGALVGPIRLQGLDMNSVQADRAILQALDAAGVGYAMDTKGIVVHPAAIKPFQFDATDCPDLFPPLVALAAFAQGDTILSGAHRLTHKESDRAHTLKNEFAKMGVLIEQDKDQLIVHGKGVLTGALVSACGDHRIAMALAVAGLRATGATEITGAEAIKKSYPDFFADLSMLGASLSLPDLN
ncbi:MAG: 3-phosphoshikimate 1-carboxyvinyltransferase [Sphingomonadales bacterium]|nr:3-phosphoshikimate 1-carboxyvinyltransferase [Sphingomonadales bacterium]